MSLVFSTLNRPGVSVAQAQLRSRNLVLRSRCLNPSRLRLLNFSTTTAGSATGSQSSQSQSQSASSSTKTSDNVNPIDSNQNQIPTSLYQTLKARASNDPQQLQKFYQTQNSRQRPVLNLLPPPTNPLLWCGIGSVVFAGLTFYFSLTTMCGPPPGGQRSVRSNKNEYA